MTQQNQKTYSKVKDAGPPQSAQEIWQQAKREISPEFQGIGGDFLLKMQQKNVKAVEMQKAMIPITGAATAHQKRPIGHAQRQGGIINS
jgi:hypothetical protein